MYFTGTTRRFLSSPGILTVQIDVARRAATKHFTMSSKTLLKQTDKLLSEKQYMKQRAGATVSCVEDPGGSGAVEDCEDPVVVSDRKLLSFIRFVKLDRLSAEERLIHEKHVEALREGQEMYRDPSTGYDVITRLSHLRRGHCCGNACRHCPYSHKKVPKELRTKTFNSAFFI
ncbi:uncharacterized protein LOC101863745 [Aplysia californica]|uniref:Uncharacterized protein LOC101863745 n=1 Tax=Aplysia californica TaxID=6500 RepID=A0ABM0JQE9_APLCA|nr:uncharacterized protein LOC101863745 [Aplysia californica]